MFAVLEGKDNHNRPILCKETVRGQVSVDCFQTESLKDSVYIPVAAKCDAPLQS